VYIKSLPTSDGQQSCKTCCDLPVRNDRNHSIILPSKSSESVQCAMLKACDACADMRVIAHWNSDSEDFPILWFYLLDLDIITGQNKHTLRRPLMTNKTNMLLDKDNYSWYLVRQTAELKLVSIGSARRSFQLFQLFRNKCCNAVIIIHNY